MANAQPTRAETRYLGFVLIPGFSLVTLSCAIEAFRLTNERSQHASFVYRTIGVDSTSVRANDGLLLTTDCSIEDEHAYDIIFMVSSLDAVEFYDDRLAGWLRRKARAGVTLAPIGSAALIAARAGLLNGYRCAINWKLHNDFTEHFPDVLLSRDLFCFDRERLTSAGGLSTIDFGFAIVAQTVEQDLLAEVADLAETTMLSRIRPATDSQRMAITWRFGVSDARIVQAIEIMEHHIERPVPVVDIARTAGISGRQLERLFHKHLGKGPLRVYLEIRLRQAREMLVHSSDSILVVALKCGFSDAPHFTRQFKAHFGQTPAAVRFAVTSVHRPASRRS